jgi:hypothetical protein
LRWCFKTRRRVITQKEENYKNMNHGESLKAFMRYQLLTYSHSSMLFPALNQLRLNPLQINIISRMWLAAMYKQPYYASKDNLVFALALR